MQRLSLNAPTGEQLAAPAARVIDPVLTAAARGYTNAMFIHRALFPAVPTSARGGVRIEFDRTDFRRTRSKRAPGATTQRVQFGHEGHKFALNQHRLAGMQPLEPAQDAMTVAGLDMNMRTVDGTQMLVELEKEIDAATIATAADTYDASHRMALVGTAQWSDDSSDPVDNVTDAIEIIRQATARRPNTIVMGGRVFSKLRKHSAALDHIRYKDAEGRKKIATREDIGMMFDIPNVVVGDAIYADENDNTIDVWGNNVVIAYTEIGSTSRYVPSYGYGYQLTGTPLVEEPVFDRDTNSWLYYFCDEYSQEVVGKDAGFLIQDAVA